MLLDEQDKKDLCRILHIVNNLIRKRCGEDAQRLNDTHMKTTMDGLEYCLGKCSRKENMQKGELHGAWMMDKLESGWRYGPVVSRKKKQHPNMVPFDYLPMEQREKDNAFWNILQNVYTHVKNAQDYVDHRKAQEEREDEQ